MRGCVPSAFPLLGCFESGFAGASELSKLESFLWAIRSLASELSEVEVLSPLLSSGHWSGASLLSGHWSSERAFGALLNAERDDTICWRVLDVSRLLFIKCCRRVLFIEGSHLKGMHLLPLDRRTWGCQSPSRYKWP